MLYYDRHNRNHMKNTMHYWHNLCYIIIYRKAIPVYYFVSTLLGLFMLASFIMMIYGTLGIIKDAF